MATEALKVLGQLNPAALTLLPLYTVPAATSVTSSTITVCNQSGVRIKFRVSVAVAGAVDDPKQYLFYDIEVSKEDSFLATIGMTLAATDVVRVYADNANVSFNLFGVELT